MKSRYFNLLEARENLEKTIEYRLRAKAEEEEQNISIMFYPSGIQVSGTHFITSFPAEGEIETIPLCNESDMPQTLDAAMEKTKTMFEAKAKWEAFIVKLAEVLEDG